MLEETVEMDAMHLGGHARLENEGEEQVDGRHAENQTGKRMAVQALRERGKQPDPGGRRPGRAPRHPVGAD